MSEDLDIDRLEFNALSTLRKRYRMRDAGTGKYDALCPAHDDNNRSLRVYRCADGRLRFRCYAGCAFNDVRKALGLPEFKGGSGWRTSWRPAGAKPSLGESPSEDLCPDYDYPALAREFALDGPGLIPLADELGVSAESLLDARVGRCNEFLMFSRRLGREVPVSAWTFPMAIPVGPGKVRTCRLRMRGKTQEGKTIKYTFTGGEPGLFLGRRWLPDQPLMIVEGPTDRAVAFDWGFNACGLPSASAHPFA
jgi:hypothetical protein